MRPQPLLLAICLLSLVGCREGGHVHAHKAENVILDAVDNRPTMFALTVEGHVSCLTCPRDASSMVVELLAPNSVEPELGEPAVFGLIGAYNVSANVPYNSLVRVRVTLYAPGGVQTIEEEFVATGDISITTQKLEIDLSTESD